MRLQGGCEMKRTWFADDPVWTPEKPDLCEEAVAWYTPLRPLEMTAPFPNFELTAGMQCASEPEVACASMR